MCVAWNCLDFRDDMLPPPATSIHRTLDFRPMDFGDKEFPWQVGVFVQPHDWTVFKTHPGWLGHIGDEILPSYARIISCAIMMIS